MLGLPAGSASNEPPTASLFSASQLAPNENRVFQALSYADEALQLDELMEKLEAELTSSEVFTALFELELAGRVKQLPGKNFVRSF